MRILSAFLLILAAFIFPAQAAIVPVLMDIYPSGVKVIFETDAAPNMTMQIPAAFNFDSVKPVVTPGIAVDYFQKRNIINSDAVPGTLKELDKKIKDKEREIDTLAAQISAGKGNLEMIMNITKGDIRAQNPTDYIKSLMAAYSDSSVDMNLLTRKLDTAKADLARMKESYQNSLPAGYDRLIEISMGVRGTGKVRLEAYSYAAGWSPSYKMNLNSKTGEVKSTFVAQAFQKTGVAYNGEISFFTQNPPSGPISIPTASPMVVDLVPESRPAPAPSVKAFMNQASETPVADMAMSRAEAAAPAVFESLTNFSVKGRGRLGGDGAPVSVDLGNYSYKAELKTILNRDYSREGHLVVKLTKIAEPILPGYIDLSVDGQNSGTTYIINYGRGEDVSIPFGFMPLIKVNKTSNVTKSGSGFISGTVQDGYTLEAVNGSNMEAEIELVDRIPFSANEKIAVDQIAVNPAPTTNKENVLTWNIRLKPGENRKFTVSYRLRYPSDKQIYYR